jgi:hypothetical protein
MKHPMAISKTDYGMQIDVSDEQCKNAREPMRESLEPDSNVTLESALQPQEQPSPISKTDHGIQIDESDEQPQNPSDSICESLEPDSNVTLESASHL